MQNIINFLQRKAKKIIRETEEGLISKKEAKELADGASVFFKQKVEKLIEFFDRFRIKNMKNKVLIPVVILAILGIGVGTGYYVAKTNIFSKPSSGESQEEFGLSPESNQVSLQEYTLEKEDFSINVPAGWKEASPPSGVSAMVVNVKEQPTEEAAKRINFKSYFAISYDTLEGKTREKYLEDYKHKLKEILPGIVFVSENSGSIDEKDAYFIEADLTQQGVDFKVFLVLVRGKGDDIWTISFNTLKSDWPEYKDLFYQTAESFKVR